MVNINLTIKSDFLYFFLADFLVISVIYIYNLKQRTIVDERIRKYFDGEMDMSHHLDFLSEVKTNESLKQSFIEYCNLLGLFSFVGHPDDEQVGRGSYLHFNQKRINRQRKARIFGIMKYAVTITLLVIGSWMASGLFHTYCPQPAIAENILHVPAGQRVSLTLSDGTEVWVNAKSTLIYPSHFAKDNRKVKIMGEAFFSVTKDAQKPFIVSTSELDVKVLGTTFNVSDYAKTDFINISLLEGAVEVYKPGNASKKIVMKPDERLDYKDGIMTISHNLNEDEFLWKDGIYAFDKVRLDNIVKKLELYYDTQIIIKNKRIIHYEYTGKFRQRDGVMEILKVIQQIHKFKITKDEVNNTIILE